MDTHSEATGEEDRGQAESEKGLLAALQAERAGRQTLERQVAALEGRIAGIQQVQPKETAKVYTETELQTAVNKGSISEAQANTIRQRQIRDETVELARKTARDELQATTTKAAIDAELGRFSKALPGLTTPGSPEREKAEAAFQKLLNRGYSKDDPRTELMAVELAFGAVEALEAVQTRGERETHQEVGGSGAREGGSSGSWPKDMPAKNRRYYETQIAKGVYSKESALKEWGRKK